MRASERHASLPLGHDRKALRGRRHMTLGRPPHNADTHVNFQCADESRGVGDRRPIQPSPRPDFAHGPHAVHGIWRCLLNFDNGARTARFRVPRNHEARRRPLVEINFRVRLTTAGMRSPAHLERAGAGSGLSCTHEQ
ncbi:hypothetical protein EVAR_64459_1 [Eumeta japonica]|uniref:Uncharacterized protein n=1 Tax=Eumeta variegata TaxID=151549 RepID=A0A4C1ZJ65_EUMVA|nr:hypothetical protein EVAR_64459_1 [Eumeta japonica]